MKIIRSILLIVLLISCRNNTKLKSTNLNTIDNIITNLVDSGFNGSVSIATNEKIIFMKSYGWAKSESKIPVTNETLFYLASTTKGVTGLVALLAQKNGLIKINDQIGMYFSDAPASFQKIKLHQLLTHTSGLNSDYNTFGAITTELNAERIFSNKINENISFNYSGANYWMAALMMDAAIGRSYKSYLKNEIFDILNLKHAGIWYEIEENFKDQLATKLGEFPVNGNSRSNWGYIASGGIVMNISDLTRYSQKIVYSDLLNDSERQQLFGPHLTLRSGIGVGYGWFTSEAPDGSKEIWSRGGESFGHNSSILWLKDHQIIINVLSNSGEMEGFEKEGNRVVTERIRNFLIMD